MKVAAVWVLFSLAWLSLGGLLLSMGAMNATGMVVYGAAFAATSGSGWALMKS
jgi:hypothetical protein